MKVVFVWNSLSNCHPKPPLFSNSTADPGWLYGHISQSGDSSLGKADVSAIFSAGQGCSIAITKPKCRPLWDIDKVGLSPRQTTFFVTSRKAEKVARWTCNQKAASSGGDLPLSSPLHLMRLQLTGIAKPSKAMIWRGRELGFGIQKQGRLYFGLAQHARRYR